VIARLRVEKDDAQGLALWRLRSLNRNLFPDDGGRLQRRLTHEAAQRQLEASRRASDLLALLVGNPDSQNFPRNTSVYPLGDNATALPHG
jgi:hypothetical protein